MFKKVIGLWMVSIVLLCSVLAAQADGQDSSQKRVTVKYDQADVRFVLKQLFENAGANYSLDPNVQGTVTVSLTDVPFTVALDAILRQLNLTYRLENGVYYILPRQTEVMTQTTTPTAAEEDTDRLNLPEKFQLKCANPSMIADLFNAPVTNYAQYELGMLGGFGGLGSFGGFGNAGGFGNLGSFGGFGSRGFGNSGTSGGFGRPNGSFQGGFSGFSFGGSSGGSGSGGFNRFGQGGAFFHPEGLETIIVNDIDNSVIVR
ncbi:MAG: hypothetical protein SNJ72_09565 [Fimbriimonadales bacterium]